MVTSRIDNLCDVVVIGGGPSGTTAATFLAQQGHKVQLFERERFPRFHIGESLIPETYWVLERLKMLPKLKGSINVKKYSVQFVTERGKLSEPFYFLEHKPHESSQTWQVYREEFDQLMLENSREQGVIAHEGARVLEVLFEGERAVGVRVQLEDDSIHEVRSRVVVDASGQSTMIMGRLGIREWDPILKKAALWTYWKGAHRDQGRDEGATIVMQTQGKNGWFWYIPLRNDIVSVGVVAGYDYLFQNRPNKDLETVYFEEVDRCPGLQPRIKNAERCGPFRAAKEYSYRSQKAAGDGWVLVGDAFGFLDPLYSSGVLLALKSGQLAADAVHEGLVKNDLSGAQLGCWEPDYVRGMERMRRLVCAFYDGFSFGRFVKKYPHLKGYITDLLIGDLFRDEVDQVWEPMEIVEAERRAEQAARAAAEASAN
ncbi:MAG: NAD(P)/FAD-dependent oxidoreductase [Pirellulales bacterium]